MNMNCDSHASFLACTFACPCLGHEPKARVATHNIGLLVKECMLSILCLFCNWFFFMRSGKHSLTFNFLSSSSLCSIDYKWNVIFFYSSMTTSFDKIAFFNTSMQHLYPFFISSIPTRIPTIEHSSNLFLLILRAWTYACIPNTFRLWISCLSPKYASRGVLWPRAFDDLLLNKQQAEWINSTQRNVDSFPFVVMHFTLSNNILFLCLAMPFNCSK